MDIWSMEVCISNLQHEIWQLNRENSHGDRGAMFSTFYIARLLNDNITAVDVFFVGAGNSPNYARLIMVEWRTYVTRPQLIYIE